MDTQFLNAEEIKEESFGNLEPLHKKVAKCYKQLATFFSLLLKNGIHEYEQKTWNFKKLHCIQLNNYRPVHTMGLRLLFMIPPIATNGMDRIQCNCSHGAMLTTSSTTSPALLQPIISKANRSRKSYRVNEPLAKVRKGKHDPRKLLKSLLLCNLPLSINH